MAGNTNNTGEPPSTRESSEEKSINWAVIADAGGIYNWIQSELRRQKLLDDDVDTSAMSAKQRKAFRAKRDQERRVRGQLRKQAWASYRAAHIVHAGVGVFYHDTADADKFDIADPEGRRETNATVAIADAQALANILGLSMSRLRWLVYNREVDTGCHYHFWTVPKRDGGKRLISAPKPDLKAAQTWIARHITEHLPVHGAAHGFVPGRSTVTNASAHAGAAVVFKFDIRDFYPSVTTNRVKGLIRKAGYGEQVATLIALLCTEFPREELVLRGERYYVATGPRGLPQGAPTSPSITNALCMRLDCRLHGLAKSIGLRYTRYADDLTFSWHGDGAEAPVMRLKHGVGKIVADEGFEIKHSKTRILRSGRRQRITGLIVNRVGGHQPAARVPRKTLRQLRVAIHKLENGQPAKESLEQLRGWAAYVYMTDKTRGAKMLERISKLAPAGKQTHSVGEQPSGEQHE